MSKTPTPIRQPASKPAPASGAKPADTAKPKEGKRDKFVRLAPARVTKTINAIRVLGNMSNKNSYEYSDADVTAIESALKEAVENTMQKFKTRGKAAVTFALPTNKPEDDKKPEAA